MIATYVPSSSAADGAPVTGGSGGTGNILEENTTYYVRSGGSDSADGTSTATAFLTVQKALTTIATTLVIPRGITVTVDIGAGTFSETVFLPYVVGGGSVIIKGAGSSSTTVTEITCYAAATTVQAMTLTGGTNCITASRTGQVTVGSDVVVGTVSNAHFLAVENGSLTISADYTVSGNAAYHYQSLRFGIIFAYSVTGTIGTRTFSVFAFATFNGYIESGSMSYTGSVTGQRYNGSLLSNIYTNGGGASYFPGSVAGAVATSAIYG